MMHALILKLFISIPYNELLTKIKLDKLWEENFKLLQYSI